MDKEEKACYEDLIIMKNQTIETQKEIIENQEAMIEALNQIVDFQKKHIAHVASVARKLAELAELEVKK